MNYSVKDPYNLCIEDVNCYTSKNSEFNLIQLFVKKNSLFQQTYHFTDLNIYIYIILYILYFIYQKK